MTEKNQSKWVGIRGCLGMAAIPTTESAPLTDILVAPSAGDPEFNTRTRKRAPSIGDLMAPEDIQVIYDEHLCVGAGDKYRDMYTIPAGKIGVHTLMIAQSSSVAVTYIFPYLKRGGVYNYLFRWAYTIANERKYYKETLYGKAGDIFGIRYTAAADGSTLRSNYLGYYVPTY